MLLQYKILSIRSWDSTESALLDAMSSDMCNKEDVFEEMQVTAGPLSSTWLNQQSLSHESTTSSLRSNEPARGKVIFQS